MSSHPLLEARGRHPTFLQYVAIAIFLFAITAVEFFIIYVDALEPVVVWILILLSAIKFATVIFFYMHLKFDAKLFTWLFVGGLALGFAVVVALMALHGALSSNPDPRPFVAANAVPYDQHGESPDGRATPEPTPPAEFEPGDPALGRQVFSGKGTCAACHRIEGVSTGAVGPDLTHIATVAETRRDGLSAQEYIIESIENPGAYVVEGFQNVMPPNLKNSMSAAEFNGLVTFLLEQE